MSVSHFLSSKEFLTKYGNGQKKCKIEDLLVENSLYPRSALKRRLIKENILKYECEMCKNDGNWFGKTFSLILDHINGINNDNRLENLRFLCPNCNATLDTHCGKNRKIKKTKKIIDTNFYIEKNRHLRIVERPDKIQLEKEIIENGYAATGRKYGVSDNSIRRWKKMYEASN